MNDTPPTNDLQEVPLGPPPLVLPPPLPLDPPDDDGPAVQAVQDGNAPAYLPRTIKRLRIACWSIVASFTVFFIAAIASPWYHSGNKYYYMWHDSIGCFMIPPVLVYTLLVLRLTQKIRWPLPVFCFFLFTNVQTLMLYSLLGPDLVATSSNKIVYYAFGGYCVIIMHLFSLIGGTAFLLILNSLLNQLSIVPPIPADIVISMDNMGEITNNDNNEQQTNNRQTVINMGTDSIDISPYGGCNMSTKIDEDDTAAKRDNSIELTSNPPMSGHSGM